MEKRGLLYFADWSIQRVEQGSWSVCDPRGFKDLEVTHFPRRAHKGIFLLAIRLPCSFPERHVNTEGRIKWIIGTLELSFVIDWSFIGCVYSNTCSLETYPTKVVMPLKFYITSFLLHFIVLFRNMNLGSKKQRCGSLQHPLWSTEQLKKIVCSVKMLYKVDSWNWKERWWNESLLLAPAITRRYAAAWKSHRNRASPQHGAAK